MYNSMSIFSCNIGLGDGFGVTSPPDVEFLIRLDAPFWQEMFAKKIVLLDPRNRIRLEK